MARRTSYPEFLASLDLISISLIGSSFSGDRREYLRNMEHQLSVSWRSEAVDRREDFFDVRVDVAVRVSAPKSKDAFFQLTAGYVLHIHASPPIDAAHVARFADSEIRLLVWPYVREYVSSISGRMHVPPIVLPITGSDEG